LRLSLLRYISLLAVHQESPGTRTCVSVRYTCIDAKLFNCAYVCCD
jgi:hypothetical protein